MRLFSIGGLLLLACGPTVGEEDQKGLTESSDRTDGGDSATGNAPYTSDGADFHSESGTEGEEDLTHGVVRIQLVRDKDTSENVFENTAEIHVLVNHEACLDTFYYEHPFNTPNGPEGMPIFGSADLGGEGWLDRLCDPPIDAQVPCSVELFVYDGNLFGVSYFATDPNQVEGNVLRVGPFPNADIADCADGGIPSVRFVAVYGESFDAIPLWKASGYFEEVAFVDQEETIVVSVVEAE